jgi:hypothetical protein
MKELLEIYGITLTAIFAAFGIKDGCGELDIKDKCIWSYTGDTVYWIEHDDPAEEVYTNEIIGEPIICEHGYTMFYVDNGCGDKFYQIFANRLYDETIGG